MASNVDLCNRALIRLGHKTIQALTENSKEAYYCRTFFDACRKATLHAYDWNFATEIKPLAPNQTAPYGYAYAYVLPPDCIRARRIFDANAVPGLPIPFKIRKSKTLVTNQPNAILEYTADIDNAAFFDPEFEEAFSYRLAADLAAPITSNAALAQSMLSFFNQYVSSAQAKDANEGTPESLYRRGILDARA